MTLDMPTPETLEEEAAALETLAAKKERLAAHPYASEIGRGLSLQDARIFRDEAASKRAKAERMRKAAQ